MTPEAERGKMGTLPMGGALVAATLIVLMVGVLVGSLLNDRAASRAQLSAALNAAYRSAATGIAAEESLERKYRLQPGPAPLMAHEAAEVEVVAAMRLISQLGSSTDRAAASKVLAEHVRYVVAADAMFEAVRREQPVAVVNAIDVEQVDPVFSVMQQQVYAAAASHEARAESQLSILRRTERTVLASNGAALIVAVLLIGSAGSALTRSRRRLIAQNEASSHQALHDALTGLPNRALFQDRTGHALKAAFRTRDQVAVMLLDIDRFKDVNDTLGHHYGDVLLRQIADRFAAAMRAGDSVARLGGDEFAVLLSCTTHDEAIEAARRISEVLDEPFIVKDIALDVEASIGIALAGRNADVETLIRHADVAMYEAKASHVAFTVYELCRDDNTVDRLALLGELRRAITRGELVLHYQPKVNAATGELHSVEALVRWQHPTRGLLVPDQFIPVTETTALIHALTTEVLRLALTQARVWLDRGWAIPIAVNISSSSLHNVVFPAQVQSQLDAANVPAAMLGLELTESAVMTDPARALEVLRSLDAMGVSLSIDDFGTGYSSMAYLKDLPVNELKIDRSFVIGMTGNDSNVVLVQSAIDLGHNLGLHVVAEGVEDSAAQDALHAMGCDLVQGFHILRPMPALDLDHWLEEHPIRGPNTLNPTSHRLPSPRSSRQPRPQDIPMPITGVAKSA